MIGGVRQMIMSMGRRKEKQADLFIAANQIAKGSGHPFYCRLNQFLDDARFDSHIEGLCQPYYKEGGRIGIPPGVYFRMLFVGYFEGLSSQRGIAWRCADSLALRGFLGYTITEATPVHASMTIIRQRLPESVFAEVFGFTLRTLNEGGFLKGKAFGVDATTLEADAAMRSIVRRDNGADWKQFLRELAQAEGIEDPSDDDLQRMDRKRKAKKVSNQDWESKTDPDSRITKMKEGRTHLAYKAEHTVQLESAAIVAAHVTHADRGDTKTCPESLEAAQQNLHEIDSEDRIEEAVLDKGYHSNDMLAHCQECGIRSYIAEPKQTKRRRWKGKPAGQEQAYRNNHARMQRAKGKKLSRWRSERAERTFAHVCETGGSRRSWLRGLENVRKVHQIKCGAYNIGLYMRLAFGMRKPRNWDEGPMGSREMAIMASAITASVVAVGALLAPEALNGALTLLLPATVAVLITTSSKVRSEFSLF